MPGREAKEFLPAVRRARFEQLTIYEISDLELQLLERGSAESVFLTFAIFLLSSALSFLITLLTTPIDSNRTFIVFVVLVAVGGVSGCVLLAIWWWHHRSRSRIIRDIRDRLPPEGEAAMPIVTIADGDEPTAAGTPS